LHCRYLQSQKIFNEWVARVLWLLEHTWYCRPVAQQVSSEHNNAQQYAFFLSYSTYSQWNVNRKLLAILFN